MGSSRDIPSVSEVNFLKSHTSKLGCRSCTIIASSKKDVLSFRFPGNAAENPPQPLPRLLIIEEIKSSAPSLGAEEPSLFRNLPPFSDPTYVGLYEFYLFG
ncbi:hypothetical protein MUCCIDRAFT_112841 [Mucor lusitanicus CBS 277.49]|uniref:Uncharacterized protein n=1 Tax=Mucor lusitanicus CBS 277.49 TaxID=747725 RepID=A0A168JN06_MUCCL|nr:hypothetical protein MUCCIDRAFT_112841 [Mucor lusitanicus CBS 277.49]